MAECKINGLRDEAEPDVVWISKCTYIVCNAGE